MVQFLTWIRILVQNLLINQSNNTEHKFSGLEALCFWASMLPLCSSWMLLWHLSVVFTYQAASGATATNLHLFFRRHKLQKLLTVGYALPEMPLSVGSKLELLWALSLPNFPVYSRISLRIMLITVYNTWATYYTNTVCLHSFCTCIQYVHVHV